MANHTVASRMDTAVRLSEDPEYGFAVGRVRALESQLLDRGKYDRLARANGEPEFLSALAQTTYARFLDAASPDADGAFAKAADENLAFFREYARQAWLLDLVRLPKEFRALKAAAKSRAAAGQTADAVLNRGRSAPGVAERVARAADVALTGFASSGDPAVLDSAIDQGQQSLALELARPSPFILGLLGLHADLENLRTLVRIRIATALPTLSGLDSAFLAGGSLSLREIARVIREPWDVVVDRFGKPPPAGIGSDDYFAYLEQGTAIATERGSLARMERLGREIELRYLRLTRYAVFGHEPLFVFYLLRENELRNLRQLHAAKLADFPDEVVAETVAWVG